MEQNERKGPGEAAGDSGSGPGQAPGAQHGYRNEVSWDGGKGRQPYTNQEQELGPAAAGEFEGGDAGDTAGRNVQDLEEVKRKPDRTEREAPRET